MSTIPKVPPPTSYNPSTVTVEEVPIDGGARRTITQDATAKANIAIRINKGKSIVAVSNLLSATEIEYLVHSSLAAAADQKKSIIENNHVTTSRIMTGDDDGVGLDRVCVRMPTVAAAERNDIPDAGGNDLHDPLPIEASQFIEERIIRRALAYMDQELKDIPQTLFGCWNAGDSLEKLFSGSKLDDSDIGRRQQQQQQLLEWSTREPAVNVYYPPDGHFGIHKDNKSLTILMPLTSRGVDFTGGGTAFWSQSHPDERRHAPSLVLAPEAGTALLFGGRVSHKGLHIDTGKRVVFVASFSRKLVGEKSKTWVVSAR